MGGCIVDLYEMYGIIKGKRRDTMRKMSSVLREIYRLYGIQIPIDKARRIEAKGLLKADREENTNYRVFTEEKFADAINTILLIYTGCPEDVLKERDRIMLDKHIHAVKKIAPALRIPRNWS